jgi:hypothetical protein
MKYSQGRTSDARVKEMRPGVARLGIEQSDITRWKMIEATRSAASGLPFAMESAIRPSSAMARSGQMILTAWRNARGR